MFKRLLLAATFLGAFTFAGVGIADDAQAWRRARPYRSYYYGPRRTYYRYQAPYRSYYYGPRYYRPYYDGYYYGGPSYYYGRPGISLRFGF